MPHKPCFLPLAPLPPSHPAPSPQCRASSICGLCDDDHCVRHTLTRTAHCFRFRFAEKEGEKRCLIHASEKDGMIVNHLLVPHLPCPLPRLCQADQHTSNLSSWRNCNNPRSRRFASATLFAHAHVSLPTLTWLNLLGPEKWTLTESDTAADDAETDTQR